MNVLYKYMILNYFPVKIGVIDLKVAKAGFGRYAAGTTQEGISHAFRQTGFLTGDGLSPASYLSTVRPALSWASQGAPLHLSRSIPHYGFCPTDLSRKPARHRGLPACTTKQVVSHWDSEQPFPQYTGRKNGRSGLDACLEYLCWSALVCVCLRLSFFRCPLQAGNGLRLVRCPSLETETPRNLKTLFLFAS